MSFEKHCNISLDNSWSCASHIVARRPQQCEAKWFTASFNLHLETNVRNCTRKQTNEREDRINLLLCDYRFVKRFLFNGITCKQAEAKRSMHECRNRRTNSFISFFSSSFARYSILTCSCWLHYYYLLLADFFLLRLQSAHSNTLTKQWHQQKSWSIIQIMGQQRRKVWIDEFVVAFCACVERWHNLIYCMNDFLRPT